MQERVLVWDPTGKDSQSRVRGVGRYLQLLKETFGQEFMFTDTLPRADANQSDIFINPFFNPLSPPLINRRLAGRQIAVIHDLIPLKYPARFPAGLRGRWHVFLNRLNLRHYDHIITDSWVSKKDITALLGVAEERISVAYPGLPASFPSHPSTPPSGNSDYFLYVGDATWNKNLVNIARAVKTGAVPCVFVGKVFASSHLSLAHPWQQELKEFLNLARGDGRFIFPGFISNEKLASLYAGARANLLVSRDEGYGFSYVEASSLGCPSVLADRPIFHEIAGDAALFADPENPEEIAGQMQKYAASSLRKEMGLKALQRSKKYNSSSFREEFLGALSRL